MSSVEEYQRSSRKHLRPDVSFKPEKLVYDPNHSLLLSEVIVCRLQTRSQKKEGPMI
jgi:hypothetical protein